MARNDVYLNINALSPADAVVTGQQDMTAATVPELVLGDTPTFNFYFTDNTNVWPSWAGNASYSLTWALSDAVAGDFSPAATTGNATPITGGWSVVLPLNSYDLVGLLNTKRVGQPYPVTNLWQQLRVTDPSGNEITRAMFWTPVRYRAISDTQNTESASPTGGRFVTVNNVNTLTTPTAAQFYAANPVPTSALGTASNGQLLIGNGTGFTKATLTAGTGVSITNGSGSITIDASGAQETLTATVKNAESVAITKGQVVYLFGATGGFASVKLAYNTSDATSAKTFGVVSSTSIAANGTGTVTCVGVVDGLNLGAYNDGDTLYLGATPGSVTATKPYAPNHLVYVGIVERANNGNGELYVRVQNGYELDEIHDVQINAPKLAGQTLIYDQTNDLWKNARLTGTANQITVTNADAAVTLSIPTNPTLPGNLTVSGTGTSTFGGNLTVNGTGTSSFAGPVTGTSSTNGYQWTLTGSGIGGPSIALDATNATVANRYSGLTLYSGGTFQWGLQLRAGDGKFHIYDGVRGADALTVDVGPLSGVAGTTTVGGNLTVSGTGTTSLGGAGSIISLSASGRLQLGFTFSRVADPDGLGGWLGGYNIKYSSGAKYDSTGATGGIYYAYDGNIKLYSGGVAVANTAAPLVATFATSGNLLLGTTTDSGNGKLQLATHTTSAGGIGFGTRLSLHSGSSLNQLVLADTTGTNPYLEFREGANPRLQIFTLSSTSYVGTVGANSLILRTNETTALTLDSSQNATFAGTVTANNIITANTGNDYGLTGIRTSAATNATARAALVQHTTSGDMVDGQGAAVAFALRDNAAVTNIVGDITCVRAGADNTGDIVFRPYTTGTANERMRVRANGRINFASLPTSSAGLSAGDIWNDAGTLKIV